MNSFIILLFFELIFWSGGRNKYLDIPLIFLAFPSSQ